MAQGDGIFIGVRESPSDVVSPESALRIGFIHQASQQNEQGMSATKDQRTLDDILQGIAGILFPAEETPPRVTLASTDCDGDTPLHVYLWRKDTYAVRILIAHGADVNAIGDMGETPLHAAVRDASPDTLAALLAGGAREDIVSEFGKTPLQLAQLLKRDCVYRKAQSIARDMKRAKRQSHRAV